MAGEILLHLLILISKSQKKKIILDKLALTKPIQLQMAAVV